MVIVETDDHVALALVAERLQQVLINTPIVIREHSFNVGLSAGIALYPMDGETSDELLKCADIAMYRSKKEGGGYCFYHNAMRELRVESGVKKL